MARCIEFSVRGLRRDRISILASSYVAAPSWTPHAQLGEALRLTAYPRAHVEACERDGLFRAIPSLRYAFRASDSTYYSVVRDTAPQSKALEAFSALNRRYGTSRGILIPLTEVVGVRAALGLVFEGSDGELAEFWHDRRGAVEAASRRLHSKLQSAHLDKFTRGMLPTLTERQRDVLRLLANGCTTVETADRLGIGVSTVDKHVAALKRKLRAGTSAHLTALAVQHGLLG